MEGKIKWTQNFFLGLLLLKFHSSIQASQNDFNSISGLEGYVQIAISMGMQVGKRRELIIHPDLGYGMVGRLDPNVLLIFDLEVLE